MGVNSLPKTVTRQRRDCDLNPGPTVPKSSTLTTRLPSHPAQTTQRIRGFAIMRYTDLPLTMTLTTTWTSDMELGHIL